jgi:pimeloyl-ACP methyl ester carboxylesterase
LCLKTRLCNQILAISMPIWLASGAILAMDIHQEHQIAEDIATRITPDEAVWLETPEIKFQGLYREAVSKDMRGGVILLHGRHSNQDAADLIHPLRHALPEHGWSSLSVAMPLSEPDDLQSYGNLLPEAIARLQSGVAFLQQKNIGNIALVAHDTGAWVALSYLVRSSDRNVMAAVLIDPPPNRELDQAPISPDSLRTIRLPILEILSRRISVPIDDEVSRKRAVMKTNSSYRLLVVNEPDHGWQGIGDFLANRIHGWLAFLQISAGSDAAMPPRFQKR